MKILCVADHIDPLVYSAAIKERFREVDLVLSAGDLPMEYLGFIASSLNKPVGFVFGNHNLRTLPHFSRASQPELDRTSMQAQIRNYYGATYLEDRVRAVQGLLIAGLGGSMRYNEGEHQFTEFQMYLRMLRLVPKLLFNRIFRGRYLDILLTHASPRGIHDKEDLCHLGFRSMLWFMRVFKPRYLLHGHIHLYDLNAQRVTRYGRTEVINVYDHYVLDVENDDERDP
ncbi:MAG: metallophosphoesterase [Alkalispirochaeta sp.]